MIWVTWLISLLAVAGFAIMLARLSIGKAGQRLMSGVMAGLSTMLDSEMDDDAKEAAVRRAGVALLTETGRLALVLAAALAAAALPIYAADLLGWAPATETFALMLRVDYILIVSVAAILVVWLLNRGKAPPPAALGGEAYGFVDRLFHMIAFSSTKFQSLAAALDDRLFARRISQTPEMPPLFITSLARGGTTAVLNAFHDMSCTGTHIYKDMPFITAPLLWSKLAGSNAREVTRRARAHGDGLEIDLNSPEAFDEVFWMMFWPEKYRETGIALWSETDAKPEATSFMVRQFKKITMLRQPQQTNAVRYVSKNNANIARLRLLPAMFPGCALIIPVRRPAAHAASLLRQHLNFLNFQAQDEFTRRYMRDIGHLEFGQLHRPLKFPGFTPTDYDPMTGDYWLAYWIAAFEDVQSCLPGCHLVTQDDLRAQPQKVMQSLCAKLGVDAASMDFTNYFRPGADTAPTDLFSAPLLQRADALYEELAAKAIR